MSHSDFQMRKHELEKLSSLFKSKGYATTAKEIESFIELLKHPFELSDFLKKLEALLNMFETEFVSGFPIGQQFRKDNYEQTKKLIFEAINRLGVDFSKSQSSILPLIERVGKAKMTYGFIADELHKQTIKNENVIFHLYCYSYLIFVEGIFDELSRILYFFDKVSPTNKPTTEDLERLSVQHIAEHCRMKMIVFQNWADKKHIRNSIGHALAQFDSSKKMVRFIDRDPQTGKITYDSGVIPFQKFMEMALELEDSLSSFTYILVLLKIFDFVISSNPMGKSKE